jgi:D-glycero-alpha-D-manno-heptose-7-phosphate kinase
MILSRTPFRLPLGGGGTDLPSYYHKHEGFLVTGAINKYMYLSINIPAVIDKIKINYSKVEIIDPGQIHLIKHDIVRETLRFLKVNQPIEINSMADLSAGTGLGSSSSYTVGLLRALNIVKKRYVSTHDLAEEACRIEIDLIGKPIGKQDQYAAAYGGVNALEIDTLGNVKVCPLNLHQETIYEMEHRLLMFYTHIQRDANEILAEQSSKAKNDDEMVIRSMHRIKEIGREIKAALEQDNITVFGELMHEHWLEKKKISQKMSNSKIDLWYEKAQKNGAIGGKLMGAGGGGFLLFCVEEGKRRQLRSAMEAEGLRYMDFQFDWEGSKVLVNI